MKIKIIVPVSTDLWNDSAYDICSNVANQDTELTVVNIKYGPESIECEYDEAYSSPHLINEAAKSEENFDAVIIYCFSNPGLEGAKEKLSIPVVGIGEAAQIMSMFIGDRVGIITTIENSVNKQWRKTKILGTYSKIVAIEALDIPVLEYKNEDRLFDFISKKTKLLIQNHNIDTLILGCGSINIIKEKLSERFNIPIIIPGEAAVKVAESLVKMKISQSKRAYMFPPDKNFK
jgi:allantoin racemase